MLQPRNKRDFVTDAFTKSGAATTAKAGACSSYATGIDAEAIAEKVLGGDIDLTDRNGLIALLEAALPAETTETTSGTSGTGTTITLRRMAAQKPNNVGQFAPALLAAHTLHFNGGLLKSIRPIGTATTDSCDYKTLLPLIENHVNELVRQLSTPGGPNGTAVDSILKNLFGYTPDTWTCLDLNNAGGDLGELRKRCGLNASANCSTKDEDVMMAFSSYIAFAAMLGQTWHSVRQTSAGDSLSVGTISLYRYLRAITASIQKLRTEVPDDVWLANEVATVPPMLAAQLYLWVHDFVSEQAPRLLESGLDGVRSVAQTLVPMGQQLNLGLLGKAPAQRLRAPVAPKPTTPCPEAGSGVSPSDLTLSTSFCADIPPAFAKPEVQEIVKGTICHVQQFLDVAAEILSPPVTIKSGSIVDDKGQTLYYAAKGEKVFAQICGNNIADTTPVSLKDERGNVVQATYYATVDRGVKFQFDLEKAELGPHRVYAGTHNCGQFIVVPPPPPAKKASAQS